MNPVDFRIGQQIVVVLTHLGAFHAVLGGGLFGPLPDDVAERHDLAFVLLGCKGAGRCLELAMPPHPMMPTFNFFMYLSLPESSINTINSSKRLVFKALFELYCTLSLQRKLPLFFTFISRFFLFCQFAIVLKQILYRFYLQKSRTSCKEMRDVLKDFWF